MLFLLLMEVLNALIHKAESWALYKSPGVPIIVHRSSFYADDLVWFVAPEPHDLQLARTILELFERCSGLGCNVSKCQLTPIWCNKE
jgi:hypothetical protein